MEVKDILQQVESENLQKQKAVYGEKPLFLTSAERQQIEKILGYNISTPAELIRILERSFQIKVEDVVVHLKPRLLERLKARAIRADFNQFVGQTVNRLLEEFAGMR